MATVLNLAQVRFPVTILLAAVFAAVVAKQSTDYVKLRPTPRSPEPPPGPVCSREDNEPCFTNDTYAACAPGEHRNHGSVCDERRKCCYCQENTYQPWYNTCPSCILCTNCTEDNKEMLEKCNITHDTICGRKMLPVTIGTTDVPEDITSTPATGTIADQTCPRCPTCSGDKHWWHHPIFLAFTHLVCFFLLPLLYLLYYKNCWGLPDRIRRHQPVPTENNADEDDADGDDADEND